MITRLPVVDDTGDGTSGTPITAAWWTQVQDMIDARWSTTLLSATGVVNDLNVGEADVVFFVGSAPLTITGIAQPNPIKPAKPLRIINAVSSPVYLMPGDARSLPTSRLFNTASGGPTPLAGRGIATYVHGGAGSSWWLTQHEQGALIAQPLSTNIFRGHNGTVATQLSGEYWFKLVGMTLKLRFGIDFVMSGPGALIQLASPLGNGTMMNGGYAYQSVRGWSFYRALDNGVASVGMAAPAAGTSYANFYTSVPGNVWTASSPSSVEGVVDFEVN